jgi:hypothetical protein
MGLPFPSFFGIVHPMNIQKDLQNYFARTGTGPKDLAAKIGLKRWQYIKRVLDGERKGFGPELLSRVGAVIYQRRNVGKRAAA